MIRSSSITPEADAYITQQLADLAQAENIRILFAIKSGSRAWGFPSADSDYDVRFVYMRPHAAYLSVHEQRDVIETPTLDDPVLGVPLDLNGWDVRKALRLSLGSNPVLHEWLVSPIRYGEDNSAALKAFVQNAADMAAYNYHYDRLCRSAWTEISANPDLATVKRYCYALRPALIRLWLKRRADLPPMDVHTLCAGLELGDAATGAMAALFARKQGGGERDLIARIPELDALIGSALTEKPSRPPKTETDNSLTATADALFLSFIV